LKDTRNFKWLKAGNRRIVQLKKIKILITDQVNDKVGVRQNKLFWLKLKEIKYDIGHERINIEVFDLSVIIINW